MDRRAKETALQAPDLPRISVQGQRVHHPLFRPVAIDLRHGLTPEAAGVLAVLANPGLNAVRDQRALASAQWLDAGLPPDPMLAYSEDVPVGGNDQGTRTAHSVQLGIDLTSLLTRSLRRRSALARWAGGTTWSCVTEQRSTHTNAWAAGAGLGPPRDPRANGSYVTRFAAPTWTPVPLQGRYPAFGPGQYGFSLALTF